eukprot:jgi/Botrbrau1/18666/Bobra.0774s0001.1
MLCFARTLTIQSCLLLGVCICAGIFLGMWRRGLGRSPCTFFFFISLRCHLVLPYFSI